MICLRYIIRCQGLSLLYIASRCIYQVHAPSTSFALATGPLVTLVPLTLVTTEGMSPVHPSRLNLKWHLSPPTKLTSFPLLPLRTRLSTSFAAVACLRSLPNTSSHYSNPARGPRIGKASTSSLPGPVGLSMRTETETSDLKRQLRDGWRQVQSVEGWGGIGRPSGWRFDSGDRGREGAGGLGDWRSCIWIGRRVSVTSGLIGTLAVTFLGGESWI